MVNIVTIEGQKYAVDVGFGSNGLHHPVPMLPSGTPPICTHHPHRLQRQQIPDLSDQSPDQELYVFEFRTEAALPGVEVTWVPGYCFSTIEFTVSDFMVLNYNISTNPESFFKNFVILTALNVKNGLLASDVSMFGNKVKWRVMNEQGILTTTKTVFLLSEGQRLEVFKEVGINLSQGEIDGIRDMPAEILSGSRNSACS